MNNSLPTRKIHHLQQFDYSSCGAYFITICADKRKNLFCKIFDGNQRGETKINLKPCGEIAQEQLLELEERYEGITIDSFVIMPNHIHFILVLGEQNKQDINKIVCTFKSLVTILCKKQMKIKKVFQRSFYDHVIRNQQDYDTVATYIQNNPFSWQLDELYCND